jgi:hypothetical protein
MVYATSMKVLLTVSRALDNRGRDWPYETYLSVARLYETGRYDSGQIATIVGLSTAQVQGFLDSYWFSPANKGYRDLKNRIEADLDKETL